MPLTTSSTLAELALHPTNRKLTQYEQAAKKQRVKNNRIRRQKDILADLKKQAGQDVIEVPIQYPGDIFYGVTHDYMHFCVEQSRKMYLDKTIWIYRTDEMLIEFEDTLTEETFPALDIEVKITDQARTLFVNLIKKLVSEGTQGIADQIDLVSMGYDGCAATYYACRYANLHLLEKYKGNHPDKLIQRPMVYVYHPDGEIDRICVNPKELGQGDCSRKVSPKIEGATEFESKLLEGIITVTVHD
jgi:hypothetical protein